MRGAALLIAALLLVGCSSYSQQVIEEPTGHIVAGLVGPVSVTEQNTSPETSAETTTVPETTTTAPVETATTQTTTTTTQPQYENQINILYKGFDPKTLTIKQGDTVTWVSTDLRQRSHTVLILDRDPETRKPMNAKSGVLFYSDIFQYQFNHKGKFYFFDDIYKQEEDREKAMGFIMVE